MGKKQNNKNTKEDKSEDDSGDEFEEASLQQESEHANIEDESDDEDDSNDLYFPSVASDEEVEKKEKKKKLHFGSFKTMGLSTAIYKGVTYKGYNNPTPIQRLTIPVILSGSDIVAMARTGSGKTAAFLIPLLEKLKQHSPKVGARGLILSPTRELALQTMKFVKQIGKYTDLRTCLLVGGDSMHDQFTDLVLNPDIIIATPGRLMHHIMETGLSLKAISYVVFDEADRLFEMGFAEQLQEILNKLPENRQTLLFSATLPQLLVDFAKAGLNNPKVIRLDAESRISENLRIVNLITRIEEKPAALLLLLKNIIDCSKQQTIVFVATRHHAEFLANLLRESLSKIDISVIYGTMDQTARKISIAKFRNGTSRILMVTDVAARGIDIPLLDNVINYDFPPKAKLFIHRVGRAARMGRSGTAYSLISTDELPFLLDLYLFLGKDLHNRLVEGDDGKSAIYSYYGRFPQHLIDEENDSVKELLKLKVELQEEKKVMMNAFKLYCKTRTKPSPESVNRAKGIQADSIFLHPIFSGEDSKLELQKENILNSIKLFKPSQTIFEVDVTSKSAAAVVMAIKRKTHDYANKSHKISSSSTTTASPIQDMELEPTKDKSPPSVSEKKKRKRDSLSKSDEKEDSSKKKKTSEKDSQYYMNPFPQNHLTEKAMAIHDVNDNDIVLDIHGDDSESIKRKRTVMQWDRKKKKYVKVSGVDPKKRFTNESGKIVSEKEKLKAGKIYQEWKSKTKLSLPQAGEIEDRTAIKKFGNQRTSRLKFKHHTDQSAKEQKTKNELRNKEQIAKARKLSEKKKKLMRERQVKNQRSTKRRK